MSRLSSLLHCNPLIFCKTLLCSFSNVSATSRLVTTVTSYLLIFIISTSISHSSMMILCNIKERRFSQRPAGIMGRSGACPDMHSPLYSLNCIYVLSILLPETIPFLISLRPSHCIFHKFLKFIVQNIPHCIANAFCIASPAADINIKYWIYHNTAFL